MELLAGKRLPNYTTAQIQYALDQVAPTMAEAERLGVVDRVYAYGFDETPPENVQALRQLFGALKQRWPALRTVAALDWNEYNASVKLSLPVDVWVEEPEAMTVRPTSRLVPALRS